MTALDRALFLRIVRKDREIYALEIITLSFAFACAVIVFLFCWNEFSFDRFNRHDGKIFRILKKQERFDFEGNRFSDRIPISVFNRLDQDTANITVARCKVLGQRTVLAIDGIEADVKVHAVDKSILSVFPFGILNGNLRDFKNNTPGSLISESLSMRLFGSAQSAGRKIMIKNDIDTISISVAAVYKDFPPTMHDRFLLLIAYDTSIMRQLNMDPMDASVYGRWRNAAVPLISPDKDVSYQAQPLTEIHFGRRVIGESAMHGERSVVLILILIASLIFLLGFTNFINLTTLTLPNRSKELAVKKVAGASSLHIFGGMLTESFFVVTVSFVLAVAMVIAARGLLHTVLPVDLSFLFSQTTVIISYAVLLITITTAAPMLIAIRFVRATPTRLLSTEKITFPRLKRIITIVQLGVCLSLLVGSMVVSKQVARSLVKEPGRNKDQIVYLKYPPKLTDDGLHRLENSWGPNNMGEPHIEGVTAASHLPLHLTRKNIHNGLYTLMCDRNFAAFFRYPLKNGRWFSASDSAKIVINEQALRVMKRDSFPAIGVMADIQGLYNQSEKPMEIMPGHYPEYNFLFIRIIEVDVRQTLAMIVRSFNLNNAKELSFLDTNFENWLVYEDRLDDLSLLLAIASGIMALFAIYSLSLSLSNDRIHQVAIHKMLGASGFQILQILTGSFAMPMLIAMLVSGFVAYVFLMEWLRNFVYHVHPGISEGSISVFLCLVIIVITCARQTRRLMRRNLIEHLK